MSRVSSIEEPVTHGAAEVTPLNPGMLFHGRYRIRRCLGSGGMGAIYEVVHNETQRRCVLKTMLGSLLTDPDMRARFRLEATVTANVESDHIVDVYDAGIDDSTGVPFLVMEYLRGETLASRLRTGGCMQPSEGLTLLGQASLAVDRTHAAGIVHRDLKPENLFITQRDDGTPHVKLLDFGIAKIVAQSANVNTTRSFGTPLYMSPEQIRGDGDIDGRADLYALGQLAYTALVGHAYFEPEASDHTSVYPLLLKVMQGTAVPASERAREHGVALPTAFDAWFTKATHADVGQRFDTAAEQIAALSTALSASPAMEPSPAASTEPTPIAGVESIGVQGHAPVTLAGISKTGSHALRQPSRSSSRRNVALVALLGLALAASLGFYLQWNQAKPSKTPPAVAVTFQPVLPPAPLGALSVEGVSAQPKAEQPLEPPVPPSHASAVAINPSGTAKSSPPPSTRKRVASGSQPQATASPSSPDQSHAKVAPSTTPYDPSDIR